MKNLLELTVKILLGVLFFVVIYSCNKKEAAVEPQQEEQVKKEKTLTDDSSKTVVVQDSETFERTMSLHKAVIKADPYKLISTEVVDGEVIVTLSYGGGCEKHEFSTIWNGKFHEKEGVRYYELLLFHDANGDMCKALFTGPFVKFSVKELGIDEQKDKFVIKVINPFDFNEKETKPKEDIIQYAKVRVTSLLCQPGAWGSLWVALTDKKSEVGPYVYQPFELGEKAKEYKPTEDDILKIGFVMVKDDGRYDDQIYCKGMPIPHVNLGSIKILTIDKIEEQPVSLQFKLPYNETQSYNGEFKIKLSGVKSDSRCPKDMMCIWSGKVDFEITTSSSSGVETFTLNNVDNKNFKFGNYKAEVEAVYPLYPSLNKDGSVKAEDYVLKVKVHEVVK